jgi:Fe(3+) dicitrate transport protein
MDVPGLVTAVFQLLAEPFSDPGERTWWPGLVLAVVVGFGVSMARLGWKQGVQEHLSAWIHPSSRLDLQLLLSRQLLRGLGVLPAIAVSWWAATAAVRALDGAIGVPDRPELPAWLVIALFSATWFVAADGSRFVLHLLMHRVSWLWAFHQVHHSAEVLTPLTFHRVHPIESLLYQVRGAVIATAVVVPFFWLFRQDAVDVTFFGAQAIGMVLNTLTGNFRHSHVWWRFPAALERWLISPAQHQLHHAADSGTNVNFGTWLAVWDRALGSLVLAGEKPPEKFGLEPAQRHHDHTLVGAWVGPFGFRKGPAAAGAAGAAGAAAAVAGAALWSVDAQSHEGGPEATETLSGGTVEENVDEEAAPSGGGLGEELVVHSERGVPRVAGSVWSLNEEDLRRFEQADVSRIAVTVPGVYVRAEDGFGLRPNIGIRGATAERSAKVTLLEDGVPLSPAPYAAPAAYYFPLFGRMVGLEVLKGPASIQHGPQTLGGAVQLVSRPVPTDGVTAGLDLGGGSWGTMKGHGWFGVGGARAGLLVELAQLGSTGFKDLDLGGSTGFLRTDGMARGRVASANGVHRLELKLGWGREQSNESYLGLHTEDFADSPFRRYAATALDRMSWTRTQAVLSWDVFARNERVHVKSTVYAHQLDRVWQRADGFATGPAWQTLLTQPLDPESERWLDVLRGEADTEPGQELAVVTNDRVLANVGALTRVRVRLEGGHLVEVGARAHLDDVVRLHTRDLADMRDGTPQLVEGTASTTLDRHTGAFAVATHALGRLQAGVFQVEPGLRVEAIRTTAQDAGGEPAKPDFRVVSLPGLGLVAGQGTFQGFGGVHRGFSPVGPGEDAATRPEVAWASEVGFRHHLGTRRFEVAGFWSEYQNLTGQCTLSSGCDPDRLDEQFSAGAARVIGLEAGMSQDIPVVAGLVMPIRGTFTWTHAAFSRSFRSDFPQFGDVERGDRLPYVPSAQGFVSVGLQHDRFVASVGAEARTGLRDVAGSPPVQPEVPPLFLLDASAKVRVHEGLWVYGAGQNLAGSSTLASLRPYGARPVARRTVLLGVRWSM